MEVRMSVLLSLVSSHLSLSSRPQLCPLPTIWLPLSCLSTCALLAYRGNRGKVSHPEWLSVRRDLPSGHSSRQTDGQTGQKKKRKRRRRPVSSLRVCRQNIGSILANWCVNIRLVVDECWLRVQLMLAKWLKCISWMLADCWMNVNYLNGS